MPKLNLNLQFLFTEYEVKERYKKAAELGFKFVELQNPYGIDVGSRFYFICILCGGISATLFGLGLRRLSDGLKVNLSMLFVTAGISVYAFETYLEISRIDLKNLQIRVNGLTRQQMAEEMGVPYDTRKRIEVHYTFKLKDGFSYK